MCALLSAYLRIYRGWESGERSEEIDYVFLLKIVTISKLKGKCLNENRTVMEYTEIGLFRKQRMALSVRF
jgi:hypothetical protein